jgi:RND family efflux transporter MFP subunit
MKMKAMKPMQTNMTARKGRFSPILAIFGAAVLVLSLTGCGGKAKEAASAAVSSAIPVKVLPAVRQSIRETLSYTGTVEAGQKINITPETGGKVARILVEEGQRVAKDQLLAELDTAAIELQLKQAEAALAVAQANFANTAKNKERMGRLLAEKAVSDTQYEQVKLADDAARAQVDQAQAAVNLARHGLNVSRMQAPFAGLVASKNSQVGDVVNPMMGGFGGSGSVLTLVDDSRIKVVVEVSPGDIGRLVRGKPALIRVANRETVEAAGTVSVVNSTADAMSKKFRVEVAAANPGLRLRPGTFGTVLFEIGIRENVLAVPLRAVVADKYVFIAVAGKAVRREVTLGLRNAESVEVLKGLNEGDRVIVEGNFGLTEGAAVEIAG